MGADEKQWKREGTERFYPSLLECSLPGVGKRRAELKHQLTSLLTACTCRNWE